MAKKAEVAVQEPHDNIPDHLRGYQKAKIGNVDVTDLVIPRVKLLQALSPELTEFNNARVGTFWHTIANENMGAELLAVPIVIKKSYILWSPRDDDRGILARAMDGVHWDNPGAEFTVKRKGMANSVTYRLANTVAESGLDQFGSSVPGDPQSVPAASLTYNMLWYFPEFPELSPSVIINTRSSVKPMQQLLSKIDAKPVAHYGQMYTIGIVQQKGAEGPYFNYTYNGAGFVDKETINYTRMLYDRFAEAKWTANEETADVSEGGNGSRERREPTEEDNQKY
jgi:hypothetical protein